MAYFKIFSRLSRLDIVLRLPLNPPISRFLCIAASLWQIARAVGEGRVAGLNAADYAKKLSLNFSFAKQK
jgi:hypothetical protein